MNRKTSDSPAEPDLGDHKSTRRTPEEAIDHAGQSDESDLERLSKKLVRDSGQLKDYSRSIQDDSAAKAKQKKELDDQIQDHDRRLARQRGKLDRMERDAEELLPDGSKPEKG